MIDLFFLILVCFLIANQISIYSKNYDSVQIAVKKNIVVKFLYIVLLILMILFSGLRTSYNDTASYIHGFRILDMNTIDISTIFESYGGFNYYQMLIKKFISTDPQALILITSIITNTIYVWFFAKYSKYFGWTILSYFILGPYIFSMAGLKQILAMSFSLFAIDNLLKGEKVKFVLWILFSMIFHPYIICMLLLPFFSQKVWSRRLFFVFLLSMLLINSLNLLINLADLIGKDYTIEEMTTSTINPFRVVIEFIPIFLSFIYKDRLRKYNNELFDMGVNMMILSFFMILMGLFFNPIYFARIGKYFSSINAITVPIMLGIIFKNSLNLKLSIFIYYCFFILYFILDLTKLGSISIFTDLFKHIHLF